MSSGQYVVSVAIQSMCKFQLIQGYWCVDGICRLHFIVPDNMVNWPDIDGLVQERHNSSALAMELCLSCTNPSIWHITTQYDDTLSVMSLFATDCNHHLLSTLLNPHYCQCSSVIKLVTVIFCYVSAISYLTIQIFFKLARGICLMKVLFNFCWQWVCIPMYQTYPLYSKNGHQWCITVYIWCSWWIAWIWQVYENNFFHSLHIFQVHSHLLI